MDLAQARRYARQVALPELGPEGQQRILGSAVLVVDDLAAALALETAVLYLGFAGVSEFVVVSDTQDVEPGWVTSLNEALPEAHFEVLPLPRSGIAWAAGLQNVSVVVRADFGEDSLLDACRARGIAAVVVRAWSTSDEGQDVVDTHGCRIDLLSVRPDNAGSSRTPVRQVPSIPASPRPPAHDGDSSLLASAQVVAGALAATEALWLLVGRPTLPEPSAGQAGAVMRHLQFPLQPGAAANTHNIPWPPLP